MLTGQENARVRMKICGITNLEDALCAIACGADALGFVFYKKSPRYISPEKAAAIILQMPVFVQAVGLFVNADAEEIDLTVAQCKLDVVQLHGDELPIFCESLPYRVLKAVPIATQDDVSKIKDYACAVLLDTKAPDGVFGGTGEAFDWTFLQGLSHDYPLLLAGGLNVGNIQEALAAHSWYAVDVSSGVESSRGIKDHVKLKEFCEQVILFSKGKS